MDIPHYDPTDEAKDLLGKYDPITVVKGLLNQLGACRQTREINRDAREEKEQMMNDLMELEGRAKQVLRDKGYGWMGLDIYETCKLVPDNPEK